VTRGTRPKKPSSSRGFAREAREARGSRGSWGLKTEIFFSLFKPAITPKNKNKFREEGSSRDGEGSREGEGEGRQGKQFASARMHCVRMDVELRPHGWIFSRTDGKNCPRVKSRPRGKCGRARTFGRKRRSDGKFYRRTSV
jgi:hypothetical protein